MSTVTCFVIGDPHIKSTNIPDVILMCKQIIDKIKKAKPDFIVCLGDVLDRHELIHVKPLEHATSFIYDMSLLAPTYVIIGNHDRPNNSNFMTTEHPFNALKLWHNTFVIDTTKEFFIKDRRFVFVPYVPPGRFMEALEHIKTPLDDTTCIFAHQEFRNAKMGAIVSTEGDEWDLEYPMVISGHIHDYDELQENILYTGTPIQHSFGDKDNKCCILASFESFDLTIKKIPLSLPKKRIIHISCKELSEYTIPPKIINDQLKIVVSGTTAEIQTIIKFPKIKEFQKKYKLAFKDIPSTQDVIPVDIQRKTFRQRIYEKIEKDPKLTELFDEIFGPESVPIA